MVLIYFLDDPPEHPSKQSALPLMLIWRHRPSSDGYFWTFFFKPIGKDEPEVEFNDFKSSQRRHKKTFFDYFRTFFSLFLSLQMNIEFPYFIYGAAYYYLRCLNVYHCVGGGLIGALDMWEKKQNKTKKNRCLPIDKLIILLQSQSYNPPNLWATINSNLKRKPDCPWIITLHEWKHNLIYMRIVHSVHETRWCWMRGNNVKVVVVNISNFHRLLLSAYVGKMKNDE